MLLAPLPVRFHFLELLGTPFFASEYPAVPAQQRADIIEALAQGLREMCGVPEPSIKKTTCRVETVSLCEERKRLSQPRSLGNSGYHSFLKTYAPS